MKNTEVIWEKRLLCLPQSSGDNGIKVYTHDLYMHTKLTMHVDLLLCIEIQWQWIHVYYTIHTFQTHDVMHHPEQENAVYLQLLQ